MRNKHSVLIVDSNVPFATILKESLEQDGGYTTTVAASADEALQAFSSAGFDLVIVDMDLPAGGSGALLSELRRQKADQRLMLIPLMGEELALEFAGLDVQGILPKPFFFPELPGRVAAALGVTEEESPEPVEAATPVTEAAPARPVVSSEERLAVLRERFQDIVHEMNELSREVTAEAVILTCGGKLLAHTGRLPAEEADRLAQVAGESWRTSARVAQILGREQLRFEQSVEGDEYLFYSLAVAEDIILSVALRANVTLGMVRHSAKSTADRLRKMIGVA
ncbi:MAG: hypothetical protein DRI77_09450 [Chloroflexi bacterium]|nr:MAG: hypothetical protein DRI77_09450 [Chloroflexota bacterium]